MSTEHGEATAGVSYLTAGWVVPVSGPPIRRGLVGVADGRITSVGTENEAVRGGVPRGAVRDLGPGVLLPGLVNAHCHLELSHLEGRVDGRGGFVSWVEALVAARPADPPEVVEARAAEAVEDLVAAGTVAVGDVSNRLSHLGALSRSGLAAVVFYELLAWDPAKAGTVLQFAEARARELNDELPAHVRVRLAAHAPYSVSATLLRALAKEGGPAAIHLAESLEETRFLAEGGGDWARFLERRGLGDVHFDPPHQSPVRYLEGLGVLHPSLVAAHCVQTDAADIETLAARRVSVAVCPRSNRRLGVGLPPVPAMRAAGVRLCLGTDSLASAESLDLMADVAALHAAFPEVEPAAIVRMATLGGAEALGLSDLGTIEAGKRAALAYAPAAAEPSDPLAFLVAGARAERVRL
jgi:cytosine/adenosine deaminase-related metal-dependent hydrolase